MNEIISIELKDLHFAVHHGLYPEEQKTGNEFEVNLSLSFVPSSGTITGIADTIDYTKLYELLRKEMNHPRLLLETLAMEISESIHGLFPVITRVEISIQKIHVPVAKFTGSVIVRFLKEF